MRIVFMGTPEYATEILAEILNSDIDVVAVFTQPDRPVGRKQILTPSSVKQFVIEKYPDIKIIQPLNLKGDDTLEHLSSLKPDFIVVAAYGQILPRSVLDIAPCINLHASILPKYRGASPIQSAILNAEKTTGVTSMLMDEGLDTGDMLEFFYTDCVNKTSSELFDELAKLAAKLAVSTLKNFNNIKPIKQDDSQATYCKKIKKDMGLIDFSENAEQIYNKFRAFTPWPGVFLQSGIKILNLKLSNLKGNAGEIVDIKKDSFEVATSNGSIEIFKLQEAGKKAVNSAEFINGKRLKIGDILV